ncbi:hypothetical protein WJ971_11310 [Achromobacter xylosoxidans]
MASFKFHLPQPVVLGREVLEHVILIGLGLDRAARFGAQLAVLLYQLGHRHGGGFGRASSISKAQRWASILVSNVLLIDLRPALRTWARHLAPILTIAAILSVPAVVVL